MRTLVAAAITVAAVAAAPVGVATAAPTGPSNAAVTVAQLQAAGYHVILGRTGDEPLSQCRVRSARPGQPVTATVPVGGGDTMQKVVYTPVYVEVDC